MIVRREGGSGGGVEKERREGEPLLVVVVFSLEVVGHGSHRIELTGMVVDCGRREGVSNMLKRTALFDQNKGSAPKDARPPSRPPDEWWENAEPVFCAAGSRGITRPTTSPKPCWPARESEPGRDGD